ncbi:glycosyltransferase family 87 protein [Coleofasciculus sp. G1-WW12-02]|uniref:glycosyltransferase family 87 protein n=1 Tax=Coleofasciculus sp. G1-WW12-02 TaxID=3068483 RepID=UPI004062A5A8
MTVLIFRLSQNLWVRCACLLGACVLLVIVSIIGFNQHFDTKYLYVAGLSWWEGSNAYDPNVASRLGANQSLGSFFYPPQIAPLCLLLGAFPWTQAKVVMTLVNGISAGVLAYFSVLLVKQPQVKQLRVPGSGAVWFIPAIVLANPFTLNVIVLGQTTLIVAAALVGGWYYAYRDKWVLSGILIAISTIKPQLSLLVILWFLLERRWRILAVAAVTTLIFCLVPMAISGPIEVFFDWFATLGKHKTIFANVLGTGGVFSLQDLFYAAGIKVPPLLPLGIVLTGLLWWYRSRVIIDDMIGLLMAIALLFGLAHHYDLVVLAPMVAASWRYMHNRPIATWIALGLLFIMLFPRNLVMSFIHSNLLLQYRIVVVLGSTIWFLVMSLKRKSEIQKVQL